MIERTYTSEDVLEHFGVKGMRWGVRNDDKGSGKPSRRQAKKQRNADIKAAREKMKKDWEKAGKKEEAYYAAKTAAGKKKAEIELDNFLLKMSKSPEAALASQRTSREKGANFVMNALLITSIASSAAIILKA